MRKKTYMEKREIMPFLLCVHDKTEEARRLIVNLRASVLLLKEGGFLLSRIALQYHRRHRA